MKTLENLRELANRAHSWTSFSPEKRGEQIINDYSEQLDGDIETLQEKGQSQERIDEYKAKYIGHLTTWLHAKSRCMSSMIAGPSNFPVRLAEKANRSEQKRYEEFQEWRVNAFKGIERAAKKIQIEEAGGEIGVARAKLANLKANHELMKAGNKRISQAKKANEDITTYLTETFNIKPHMIEWTMKFGFGLQNSNAKIKATEQRIIELEKKEVNATSGEAKEVKIPGGVIELNYQLDRITIKHDQKPEFSIISELKSHGFKWSPFHKVWMRKITQNAIFVTNRSLLPRIAPGLNVTI